MKLRVLVSALFLPLLSIPANAATSCVQGTLQSYIDLGSGGCTIGGFLFNNFAYATTVPGVAPNQIGVKPSFAPPETPGFSFSANWSAPAGKSLDSVIKYNVAPFPPSTVTRQGLLTLDLGAAKVGGLTGSATVQETTNIGNLKVFLSCTEVCTTKQHDQLASSQFNPLQVSDTVTVNGGQAGASLSSFAVTFNFCSLCASASSGPAFGADFAETYMAAPKDAKSWSVRLDLPATSTPDLKSHRQSLWDANTASSGKA